METIKESNCNILLKMDLLLTDYTLLQGNNHDQEKDLYIQILTDTLEDLKKVVM